MFLLWKFWVGNNIFPQETIQFFCWVCDKRPRLISSPWCCQERMHQVSRWCGPAQIELATNFRRSFTITEQAPTRAFSWLKVSTSYFTFKTLSRHYAKRAPEHSQWRSCANIRAPTEFDSRLPRAGSTWGDSWIHRIFIAKMSITQKKATFLL